MGRDLDLLHGTLDFLILKALSWGSLHGYGVARWIERTTDDVLAVEEGSLYPALHRLHKRGLLESEWGLSENNRRARYYRLTAAGQRELKRQQADWRRFADAVGKVAAAKAGA
jgi:transcriptional regulator